MRRKCATFRRKTNMYAKSTKGLQRLLRVYWVVHNFLRVHFTTREVPAVALGILIGKYLSSFPILVGVSKFCIISEFKDWFESESRAPGALITSGMSPLSVYSQISDECFKGPTQPGSIAMA